MKIKINAPSGVKKMICLICALILLFSNNICISQGQDNIIDDCDSLAGFTSHNELILDANNKREGNASIRSEGNSTNILTKNFSSPLKFSGDLIEEDTILQFCFHSVTATGLLGRFRIELAGKDESGYRFMLDNEDGKRLKGGWNIVRMDLKDAAKLGKADLQNITRLSVSQSMPKNLALSFDDFRFIRTEDIPAEDERLNKGAAAEPRSVLIDACDSKAMWTAGNGNSLKIDSDCQEGTGAAQSAGAHTVRYMTLREKPLSMPSHLTAKNAVLQFWLYVPDVTLLDNSATGRVELTSSGTWDIQGYNWGTSRFVLPQLKDGWNLVRLPFSSANLSENPPDFYGLNFFRFGFASSLPLTFKLDDLRIMNADDIKESGEVPGEQRVGDGTIDLFEEIVGWGSDGELGLDFEDKKEGEASLKFYGGENVKYRRTFQPAITVPADLTPENAALQFWFYVSDKDNIGSDNGRIDITSAGRADADQYAWGLITQIKPNLKSGWNFMRLDFDRASKSGNPDFRNLNFMRIFSFSDGTLTLRLDDMKIVDKNTPMTAEEQETLTVPLALNEVKPVPPGAWDIYYGDAPYFTQAYRLHKMGMYSGSDPADFNRLSADLSSDMDRQTAVTLLMKALGKESEAKSMPEADINAALQVFSDEDRIDNWARPYVAYAARNRASLFSGEFLPKDYVTGEEFAVFMLRFMDISFDGGALAKLAEYGVITVEQAAEFNRPCIKGECVAMAYGALDLPYDGGALIDSLMRGGMVTGEMEKLYHRQYEPGDHSMITATNCISDHPNTMILDGKDKIERRFEQFKDIGCDMIRINMPWNYIEDTQGVFKRPRNYIYLDSLRESDLRIKLVLGTFMSPPGWVFNKYPEARLRDQDGNTFSNIMSLWFSELHDVLRPALEKQFQYCEASGLLEKTDMLVVDLGAAGEPMYPQPGYSGLPDSFWCYADNAQADFREKMKEKYHTVSAANAAWGADFKDWDEVIVPRPKTVQDAYWDDVLTWYRDSKRVFVGKQIDMFREMVAKYTNNRVQLLLYVPGRTYTEAQWEEAVQTGNGQLQIKLMTDNYHIFEMAREKKCLLQNTGFADAEEVQRQRAYLDANGYGDIPVYGENAGSLGAAGDPVRLASIAINNRLAGMDYTHSVFALEDDRVTPNSIFWELEKAFDMLNKYYNK